MTDFAALLQPDKGQSAHHIHLVSTADIDDWLKSRPERERVAAAAQGFDGKTVDFAILPGDKAADWSVAVSTDNGATPGLWALAKAGQTLPEGTYRLADGDPGDAALGWLLAHYRFDGYRQSPEPAKARVLLTSKPGAIDALVWQAEATALVRDLVNMPPEDMGPADIEAAARQIADECGGNLRVIAGDELEQNYPMIHAVGRAATRERSPRLVEIEWGDANHPRLAIVGKGVCFDSGGLDIKSAAGMRFMKKDMGGAAHALALARLVMLAKLPVRMHLLIPAVENAIGGGAFRPGDILSTRKGLFVEVGNTDAEGRLVLGDALTRACEDEPALIIDFATLTGAARVALGPDLPALFSDDEGIAIELAECGAEVEDPVWRLPIWDGYDEYLKSDVADLSNNSNVPMAGATTAALFLRRFVEKPVPWVHFDTYAWRLAAKPGRPKGGEALGLRACWAMLRARYGR